MKILANHIGYVLKHHQVVKPLPERYTVAQPSTIEEFFIKSSTETSKGSKTYPRYYIHVVRFESVADADKQTVCRPLSGSSSWLEKSIYGQCIGFRSGVYNLEVMTDAAAFHGKEQQRVMDALKTLTTRPPAAP